MNDIMKIETQRADHKEVFSHIYAQHVPLRDVFAFIYFFVYFLINNNKANYVAEHRICTHIVNSKRHSYCRAS